MREVERLGEMKNISFCFLARPENCEMSFLKIFENVMLLLICRHNDNSVKRL